MFRVPSTPDSRRASRNDAPSTTPAGPPPTDYTDQSFTPAGPVPTSVFGSSFAGSTNIASMPAFAPSGHLNSPSVRAPLHTKPSMGAPRSFSNAQKGFAVPSSSPPRRYDDEYDDDDMDEEEEEEEEEVEEDEEGYSEEYDDESAEETGAMDVERQNNRRQSPIIDSREHEGTASGGNNYLDSPRGSKRSRNGDVMGSSFRSSRVAVSQRPRDSALPGIAKSLAANMPAKRSIEESDEAVLHTESMLGKLDEMVSSGLEEDTEASVGKIAKELTDDWRGRTKHESLAGAIGPQQKQGFARANYLASLLLQLHHPSAIVQTPSPPQAPYGRPSRFNSVAPRSPPVSPVPKALLDWLNTYHNPYPEDLQEVLQCRPSPSAHERFWDLVYSTQLRGDLKTTIRLLQTANFANASTAIEDGYEEPGYEGHQLDAVENVVGKCIDLLQTCPALTGNDWNVTKTEWVLFRNRVQRALTDLEAFAEDESEDRDDGNNRNIFQASRNSMSFSTASRRAESKVPWSIYEQLKAVYGQMQGLREEILLSAQDWLEATIYLTVWWDGQGDEVEDLTASRRSLRHTQHTRQVDVAPLAAYRRRLLLAFASVTDEPEDAVLGVNTVDPVQVGVASICEDNVEGAIALIRGWSMPIAAALVDVSSTAEWLPQKRPRSKGIMDGFDQEDLMVLSHGQTQQEQAGLDRDDFLIDYADLLSSKAKFVSKGGDVVREGWELAVRVLSRLDSAETAQNKIGQLFDKMALDSKEQVDKALAVCNDLGLSQQVRSISERYADNLAENSRSYGDAILYYARARSTRQLQSTMDLLITMSLVQSAAYPPTAALDSQLNSLLNDRHATLKQLAYIDREAAELIASHLSGYATLRKFYELRDESDEDNVTTKSGLRPLARKREAVKAVSGLIESAADSIHGGLYNSEVQGVVQVDTLLALLGEALPLMDQHKRLLKQPQLMILLRAVEDLQTVTSRLYEQTEALFQAAMSDYHGTRTSSPQETVKNLSKSTSNLSASSYGMVNSQGSIASTTDGQSQQKIARGWDWRKGIALAAGKSATGSDVLQILRVQIAKELAQCWAGAT